MDKTRVVSQCFCQGAQEGNHFMPNIRLDFLDPIDIDPGIFSNSAHRGLWDLAKARQGLCCQDLHLKPHLKSVLLRPDLSHLRATVTINHGISTQLLAFSDQLGTES